MPDGLYDRDIVSWSEQQAAILRRLAADRPNVAADWGNLIEELLAIGRSEQRAVESLLYRLLEHMLKMTGWPEDDAQEHWRNEAITFLAQARRAYQPSMRQRIDLPDIWTDAHRSVAIMKMHGIAPRPLRETCPFELDEVMVITTNYDALLERVMSS
jgi:hypothetical protein